MKLTSVTKNKLRLTNFGEPINADKIIKDTKVVAYIQYKGTGKTAVILTDKQSAVYYAEIWYHNILMSIRKLSDLKEITNFFKSLKDKGGTIVEPKLYKAIQKRAVLDLI